MDGLKINLKDLECDPFVLHLYREILRAFNYPLPESQAVTVGELQGETILCACSGGPDSTALAVALAALQAPIGFRLVLVHINHNLRGAASNADADFCLHLARALEIEFLVESVTPRGRSEEELRRLRHICIVQALHAQGSRFVFMGHTLDDQVETVLLRLFRGTGTSGMVGMRWRAPVPADFVFAGGSGGEIIRPLLSTRRQIVHEFLKRHEIASCLDMSNLEDVYARNFVRNRIMPALEERFPKLVMNIERFRSLVQEQEGGLEPLTESAWQALVSGCKWISPVGGLSHVSGYRAVDLCSEPGSELESGPESGFGARTGRQQYFDTWSWKAFQDLPEFLQGRVILRQFKKLQVEPGYENIARLKELIKSGSGGLSLRENLAVLIRNEQICWCLLAQKGEEAASLPGFSYRLRMNATTVIPELDMAVAFHRRSSDAVLLQDFPPENALCAFIAPELGDQVLTVRLRLPGDRLQPFGMSEIVRLKKFLHTHKGRPGLTWRGRQVVIANDEQVLWVPGVGIAEPARVRGREYVEIKFVRLAGGDEVFC